MKPHLTKQSYPRTGVNSIKRWGYFHFQLKEVHPLESISIQEVELIVCLKIINKKKKKKSFVETLKEFSTLCFPGDLKQTK